MEITTKRRYNKVLKTNIILCWVFLIVCFIIKLFGGNFFATKVTHPRFIQICDFITKSWFLTNLVQFTSSAICTFFYTNAICRTTHLTARKNLILFGSLLAIFLIKCFSPLIGFILDLTIMWFGIPFAFCKNLKRVFGGIALTLIFQLVSEFTKELGLGILGGNFIIEFVAMVDTYFMLALYYLYSIKEVD